MSVSRASSTEVEDEVRAIELFAGAGGLGMGMSLAGATPELIVEWDRWCCDTLRQNRVLKDSTIKTWPEPIEGDVRAVKFGDFAGSLDLVTGGPPCQPFSMGGKHAAYDDARDMFPQAIRAVREAQPRGFVFENVKGLTRAAFRNYFEYIRLQMQYPEILARKDEDWADHLARLEQHHTSGSRSGLTYHVVTQLLNAADYGVPQKRERVFFVGLRDDLGIGWHFPHPTHSREAMLADQASGDYWERHAVASKHRPAGARIGAKAPELNSLLPWRTTRDALAGLPDPEFDPKGSAKIENHRFQPGARSYPGHTGSPLDEPAKTLKAGVHGVPGGENMLRRLDGSVRYFTVRESARLQTFPDSYVLHGSWSEAMRQLGNAVPVQLARVVGESVTRHLSSTAA